VIVAALPTTYLTTSLISVGSGYPASKRRVGEVPDWVGQFGGRLLRRRPLIGRFCQAGLLLPCGLDQTCPQLSRGARSRLGFADVRPSTYFRHVRRLLLFFATMNMYWVYDLPNWLFAALTVAVAVAIGLIGFYATRKWVRRVHGDEISHNDIVGFFLGTIGLFYGITLGLVAVGTWEAYSDVDSKLDQEASALAALYRDVSNFPEPRRSELQADLREYTRQLIDVGWPLQRRGIVPQNTAGVVNTIQTHLASFEPATEGQKTLHAEAYRAFTQIVELRRMRLKSVTAGLPVSLWIVLLVGGVLNIAVTWFFHMRSQSMHFWMTVVFSGLLGLLIFLLAAMDHPFRGQISVGPEAFEMVYEQLMKPVQ
jgi:hypothetical protein